MRNISWIVGTATLSVLWLASSCDDGPNGDVLTIASSPAANSSSNSGTGGNASGGGEGGDIGSGGDGSGGDGGFGGFGGAPPDPVNGCTYAAATDLTAMNPANIYIPNGVYCVKVAQGSGLIFTLGNAPDHRYMGGVYLEATKQKIPDAQSPILPSSNQSPYTDSPLVTNPPYLMVSTGEYPWYDDKHAETIRGVVYVE